MMSQVTVTVTILCDMKKDIEKSRTNDIIQYSNNMLIL